MSGITVSARTQFYTCGGTMTGDAPSYVARQADAELLEALLQSKYCYVLTARQMGKSSLMVRAARRLEEALAPEGGAVVLLDLSSIGQNAKEESWYYTLLTLMGKRLGLSGELREFWRAQTDLSPLQRWAMALVEVILKRCLGRVVIFLDEIDMVRSLNFKTDEFFIAIRSLYNRRSEDSDIARLTFCLLGVATPSDLIQDSQLTPFNIGTRIELADFTLEEAAVLKQGLSEEEILREVLSERILYWTAGHPYLTQCLCQAVSKDPLNQTREAVDRLCEEMFLSSSARDKDTNLQFVRDRIVNSAGDLAALLSFYRQVLDGKLVRNDEADERVSRLKLSGVVRAEGELLQVRNHIYRQVFDRKWITQHMPDQEKLRQRAAFQRGVVRAVAASVVLLGIVGSLIFTAYSQRLRAIQAEKMAALKDQYVYDADMILAQQAYDHHEYGKLAQLLSDHIPRPGEADLRGWEWGFYWRLMHQDRQTFRHKAKRIVYAAAFSRDGKRLASADGDGEIKLWDIAGKKEITPGLKGHGSAVYSLAFCPGRDGLLAFGSADKTVQLWDLASGSTTILQCTHEVMTVAFSPNGHYLASGCADGTLTVWDVASRRQIYRQQTFGEFTPGKKEGNRLNSVTFSPDSQSLVAGYGDGSLQLRKAPFARSIDLAAPTVSNGIYSTAFSPDGKTLAVGKQDGETEIWNVAFKRKMAVLREHKDVVNGVAFSSDGKLLATGSWDNTIRLWEVAKGPSVHTFIGHTNRVTCVAFAPDGKTLASSADNEVKLWDARPWEQNPQVLDSITNAAQLTVHRAFVFKNNHPPRQLVLDSNAHVLTLVDLANPLRKRTFPAPIDTCAAVLSPDCHTLAIGMDNGTVTLRNIKTGKEVGQFQAIQRAPGTIAGIYHLAFSPNGRTLAAAGGDPAIVTVWNVASLHQIGRFQHTNAAEGVAFSPRGETLAVANWQGLVYLWDLNLHRGEVQAKDLISWRAHAKPVSDVAFSSDGKTLATGSEDTTVKLWNVVTHREMMTLREHNKRVTGVGFSADGTMLATTGVDDKVCLYYAVRPSE